jgi:hypothetical protein
MVLPTEQVHRYIPQSYKKIIANVIATVNLPT